MRAKAAGIPVAITRQEHSADQIQAAVSAVFGKFNICLMHLKISSAENFLKFLLRLIGHKGLEGKRP